MIANITNAYAMKTSVETQKSLNLIESIMVEWVIQLGDLDTETSSHIVIWKGSTFQMIVFTFGFQESK